MAGVNKAIILGRLGRDPEIRHTTNGNSVCNFSIATSETWKDKNTGEKRERTEWHNCVSFGKQGEIIAQYVKKGDQIYIEGKIQTDEYEKDGQKHYSTKINVSSFSFIGSNSNNNDNSGGYNQNNSNQGYFDPKYDNSNSCPDDDDWEIPF
jgi:single-strand DNA-binding protein